ncbi:MAG TPA: SOS response-associated peptidase [Pirellulales bacterium]|nr:SOS response-associated peptidase [Pirellulales bacterium]
MCGRFTLRERLNDLLREFDAEVRGEPFELFEQYNICPTNLIPVIREDESGENELLRMQWGFVPSWAKDAKFCPINAVSETVASKPMFRSAIKKRRCLIPADGFYEWKKLPKKTKGDAPWYFQVNGGKPFAFAGIWERWGELESCAILTTTPNELMAPIHDRLPVILSPTDYDAWLDPTMNDPEKLTYLYEPFPASEMTMTRVSAYVNKVGNKGPQCLEAVES